jgi:hypothetical protein
MMTNYSFNRVSVFLVPFFLLVIINVSVLYAGDVERGDTVTIVTPGVTARLCPQPMCGPDEHIMRIAQGTHLKVEGIEDVRIGSILVTWLQVAVGDNTGWISIFDTDRAPD